MCIISVKNKGVAMPSKHTLQNCFAANDDGAGFAYVKRGFHDVHIVKGFFSYETLAAAIEAHKIGAGDLLMIHFRQATHGLIDAGNCHPFPITSNVDKLREVDIRVPVAVSHNGIFGQMPKHETFSDTQKFIAGILADKGIANNLQSPAVQELLKGYCGDSSKLAFLYPAGFVLIGQWVRHKGVLFSNNGFRDALRWESRGGVNHGGDWWRGAGVGRGDVCMYCGNVAQVMYNDEVECFICEKCETTLIKEGCILDSQKWQ
jgi:hypothetical protein